MAHPRFEPTGLDLRDSERRLVVSWEDGTRTTVPYRKLRLACRCAGCVDELSGRPILDPTSVADDVGVRAVEETGLYGIRIDWSDGHSTGIYTWERLRGVSEPEP
jgi:ATP-binding protein involved in chromosome partitioning